MCLFLLLRRHKNKYSFEYLIILKEDDFMIICTDVTILEGLAQERGQAMLLKLALATSFGYDYDVERDELTVPTTRTGLSAQSREEAVEVFEDAQRRLVHADEVAFHAEPDAFTDTRVQLPLFALKREYVSLLKEAVWLAGRFDIQLSPDFGQTITRSMALTALRRGGHLDERGTIVRSAD